MGDPTFVAKFARSVADGRRTRRRIPEVTMTPSDYVLSLSALMGSLLVPFAVLYGVLQLKRAQAKPAPVRIRK